MRAKQLLMWITFVLILGGCASLPDQSRGILLDETPQVTAGLTQAAQTAASERSPTPVPSATLMRTTALAAQATPTPPPATPEMKIDVCSPLTGVSLDGLREMVSNPYAPPSRLGSDDPHQGIDFAQIEPLNRIALKGMGVQAVFPGVVRLVVPDRFPWGHAVIIETPLQEVPPGLVEVLPTPLPGSLTHPSLTCPGVWSPEIEKEERGLYLLYAHLDGPALVEVGDSVTCGQPLGAIGDSGNALNPHLHLEIRIGPAGVEFPGMAHYVGNATFEELDGYCTWRVSGMFQLVDPLLVLELE